ncbi:MAG: hypothetical protein AAGA99_02920 [Actinomycetota bacterium]
MSRTRHPALAARILTAGISTAAALGIVALLARTTERSADDGQDPMVEVRIDAGVADAGSRSSLAEWLEGSSDLATGGIDLVDLPADTVSEPS